MSFAEDLAPLFADFAVPCTVGGQSLRAIFDDATVLGTVGVAGMASSQPVITAATADLPAALDGAAVSIHGRQYVVAAVEHDGTGLTRLLLEIAA